MNLTGVRLEKLQRSLELALNQEWPQLDRMQRQLQRVTPTRIAGEITGVPVVATVATDGGENRLQLEPIRVQVLRVADSEGEIYFEDFIPLSLAPEEILRFYFRAEPRLQKFLEYLGCDWDALMPQTEFQRSNLLAMLRELMEWAALLELASQPPAKLLIRDGLLRSVLLTQVVFDRLRDQLALLTGKHGHRFVGVAKRSRVINYLTVALNLNECFADRLPAFVRVPAEWEREAAPAQYRWIGDRAMGQLYMARLDAGEGVPLMPVDVASWQTQQIGGIMALLHQSARGSFPVRGYPQALVRAHEHAHLGGLETELLEGLLLEEISRRNPSAAQQARRLRLVGQHLVEELEP